MSFIACTADCVYQEDGVCRLERAASSTGGSESDCTNYIRRD